MQFYNRNIEQSVLDNTPIKRQQPILLAWLGVLLAPVRSIYSAFSSYYYDVKLKLNYSSQTIVMEALLNDLFDAGSRRIYIVTASETDAIRYLYYVAENGEITYTSYISENSPVYSYYRSEAQTATDFYINIPTGLVYDAVALNKLINNCKLITKRYKIINY